MKNLTIFLSIMFLLFFSSLSYASSIEDEMNNNASISETAGIDMEPTTEITTNDNVVPPEAISNTSEEDIELNAAYKGESVETEISDTNTEEEIDLNSAYEEESEIIDPDIQAAESTLTEGGYPPPEEDINNGSSLESASTSENTEVNPQTLNKVKKLPTTGPGEIGIVLFLALFFGFFIIKFLLKREKTV